MNTSVVRDPAVWGLTPPLKVEREEGMADGFAGGTGKHLLVGIGLQPLSLGQGSECLLGDSTHGGTSWDSRRGFKARTKQRPSFQESRNKKVPSK